MICTRCRSWALAFGVSLAGVATAQDASGHANALPSEESTTTMKGLMYMTDTALIAAMARGIEALQADTTPIKQLDRGEMQYGLHITIPDHVHLRERETSYTEKIALLEEALRIAKELAAEEARSRGNTTRP